MKIITLMKLGFKDLLKFKLNLLVLEIFLITLSIVFITSFNSFIGTLKSKESKIYYSAVPTSFEFKQNNELFYKLDDLLKNNGEIVFQSSNLNDILEEQIVVYYGNTSIGRSVVWFIPTKSAGKYESKFGSIQKLPDCDIQRIVDSYNLNINDDQIGIVVNEGNYRSLSNYQLKNDELILFVGNFQFLKSEFKEELGNSFIEIFENTGIGIVQSIPESEKNMLIRYIFMYLIVLIILFIIGFYLIVQKMYNELFDEYKINLIVGATEQHIFIRNTILVVTVLMINQLSVLAINNFKIDKLIFLNFMFNIVLFIFLEILLWINLFNQNYLLEGEENE